MRLLGLFDGTVPGWASGGHETLGRLRDALYQAREEAMQTKDFSVVDALKAGLVEAGVEIRMSKNDVELLPAEGFNPAKLEALK